MATNRLCASASKQGRIQRSKISSARFARPASLRLSAMFIALGHSSCLGLRRRRGCTNASNLRATRPSRFSSKTDIPMLTLCSWVKCAASNRKETRLRSIRQIVGAYSSYSFLHSSLLFTPIGSQSTNSTCRTAGSRRLNFPMTTSSHARAQKYSPRSSTHPSSTRRSSHSCESTGS
jgi:hypothetical protein